MSANLIVLHQGPVPRTSPFPLAVGPDFAQFDGLSGPPGNGGGDRLGSVYGNETPNPGWNDTPLADQVFTSSALSGLTGVLDGQPLPVANPFYRVGRGYTPFIAPSIQQRLGVGQNYQGVDQTATLNQITDNPITPGDFTSIITGMLA